VNNTTKNNRLPLTKPLVDLSLDHKQGVMQHKTAVLTHMIRHKFTTEELYGIYQELYTTKLKIEPNTTTDLRILNEIPVIHEYMSNYQDNIEWVLATVDSRPASFPYQKQENQDFWVMLTAKGDRAMGLGYKCVPHDEKSGMDMFKHSSRGSLGLLTFESNTNTDIQIMTKSISKDDLVNLYDQNHLDMLTQALKNDKLYDAFKGTLLDCDTLLKGKSGDPLLTHKLYQNSLWDNIQRDPRFTRSVSMILTKEVTFEPMSPNLKAFHDRFINHLGENRLYNLDRPQDFKDIYRAMLRSYKETVDDKLVDKIHHLHHTAGIKFSPHFLYEVASMIKHGLL